MRFHLPPIERWNCANCFRLPLVGSSEVQEIKPCHGNINARGQGFSVLRNGREIRNGETLGVFTTHPEYNFQRTGRFFRGFGRPVQCQDQQIPLQY